MPKMIHGLTFQVVFRVCEWLPRVFFLPVNLIWRHDSLTMSFVILNCNAPATKYAKPPVLTEYSDSPTTNI